MKQLFLYLGATVAFIVVVGIITSKSQGRSISILPQKSAKPATTKVIKVGEKELNVVLADNPERRKIGLSQTKALSDGEGMLFTFDRKDIQPAFWMKDMTIDIDIIWIKGDKILQIDSKVPAPFPNTPDRDLPKYTPNDPIDYVLEVASGWAERNGIKAGDSATL